MSKETIKLLVVAGLLTQDEADKKIKQIDKAKDNFKASYTGKTIEVESTQQGIDRIIKERFSFL